MSNSCTARPQDLPSRILLTVVAIGMSCFAELAVAQADSSGLFTHQPSNTVSVNQLLSSDKVLRTAMRARQLLVEGLLDKAQTEIAKALHASPNCAIALEIQGAIHLRTGNLDDAATEFQKAINADSFIGQAYVGLGMLLIARSRYKDALVPLDRAESLLPAAWLVYYETAVANLQLGDLGATLKHLSLADNLATDPEQRSENAYLRALLLIKSHDFESATRYMNDAIKFSPNGHNAKPAQDKIEQIKPLLEARAALALNKPLP